MTVTIARASLVLALILGIALGVQSCRLRKADRAAVDARAKAQAIALEAAGWQRAAVASQDELARIVPTLKAEIAALQEANGRLALTSRWTGRGAAVRVPCPDNLAPPAGAPIAAPPGPSPAGLPGEPLTGDSMSRHLATSAEVVPHVRVDSALALADDGSAFAVQKVQAKLTAGLWASEWAEVTPDAESRVEVDPKIGAAWRAFNAPRDVFAVLPRGVKRWRVGWSCGVGLGYGAVYGKVDAVAACIWGGQF